MDCTLLAYKKKSHSFLRSLYPAWNRRSPSLSEVLSSTSIEEKNIFLLPKEDASRFQSYAEIPNDLQLNLHLDLPPSGFGVPELRLDRDNQTDSHDPDEPGEYQIRYC